jgi:hypothetical protein
MRRRLIDRLCIRVLPLLGTIVHMLRMRARVIVVLLGDIERSSGCSLLWHMVVL